MAICCILHRGPAFQRVCTVPYVADHGVHVVVNDLNNAAVLNTYWILSKEIARAALKAKCSAEIVAANRILYDQAVQIVVESRRASHSNIQRRLKIGYNRAARLMEDMEGQPVWSVLWNLTATARY